LAAASLTARALYSTTDGRARVLIGLAAALASVAAFAGPRTDVAVACSCGGVDPARDVPRFDAAFVGTPLSHRIEEPFVFWTFEVERAVKGALPDRLVVRAPLGGPACGLELDEGDRVGLLLRHDDARYESARCYEADS
jgi:hypothetical protein